MNKQEEFVKETDNIEEDFSSETLEEQLADDIESSSEESETSHEETKIHEKEKVVPNPTEFYKENIEHIVDENQFYLSGKERDHEDIVSLIETAEAELADLRLRKYLIEADFNELLVAYNHYVLEKAPISAIAKKSLIEYFAYELLKPLNDIGLKLSTHSYDEWETRHFSINYSLDNHQELIFSFVLPTINQRYQVEAINLLRISPETMTIEVDDERVLALIRHWSVERAFSSGQITIFNHKLNQVFAHARSLGFTVTQTLLDNTKPLRLDLVSQFELTESVLDDIFIVTMKNQSYDMEKITENTYNVLLDKGQSMLISKREGNQTNLSISSGEYHRSVIDFFINYEFLVPLMVRKA
ncbi:hypothetical protein A5844_000052 [Enterococcus sp. 10A9_DIV0425]|uniref:Uncharacterized protein n=1 Tax=Candidatus Enterococcus wittei TaxID=1987383 RepID=A0A2C9XPS0_9ENTE|nr:hypothetical protein [Enterococcus sp. 10A9_DIV0425]OTP11838.1 hypothetical protein A5844_000052 [Enterococcus sp. 10A9_DIV0425]